MTDRWMKGKSVDGRPVDRRPVDEGQWMLNEWMRDQWTEGYLIVCQCPEFQWTECNFLEC